MREKQKAFHNEHQLTDSMLEPKYEYVYLKLQTWARRGEVMSKTDDWLNATLLYASNLFCTW